MKTLLLSQADVEQALSMEQVIDAVEEGYRAYQRGLVQAGANAIEVSGVWMNYKQDTPYFLEQTIAAAREVHIPVCLVGGVRGKDTIEKILNDTPVQYVSMARPFVAKPDFMTEWSR